eukprot:gnl/MRDRNA2_/MRDRNA2_106655_c0_seq1.p1 gnl/MRDRNA2_/MRDRNA2_106655_c0~~gnl/MRDRNA2_/MRDRNA2_106655_c0_seq1.p1  ORF type:complete len:569 (-),score=95.31 gnl/MRDRNA2_/MRDRNA2_106655_c0_seq1:8-1714(-)
MLFKMVSDSDSVLKNQPPEQVPKFSNVSGPHEILTKSIEHEDVALLLVGGGLEDVAVEYLITHGIVPQDKLVTVPRPDGVQMGSAAVGKILVLIDNRDWDNYCSTLARLQSALVVQAVLAFVTAAGGLETRCCSKTRNFGSKSLKKKKYKERKGAESHQNRKQEEGEEAVKDTIAQHGQTVVSIGDESNDDREWSQAANTIKCSPAAVSTAAKHGIDDEAVDVGGAPQGKVNDVLSQVETLVANSKHWTGAQRLLQASGLNQASCFRASCVRDGQSHKGFDSYDVMGAIGAGVLSSDSITWVVDLQKYDVEVYGFLFEDTFACGLVLGGEWRRNVNPREYEFNIVPCCEDAHRPYRMVLETCWYLPQLRPSTAVLLLLLAELKPGETVLDPMGGIGTIALEAATNFERITAMSSDNNRNTVSATIKNCQNARPYLAAGSTLHAHDWDARNLKGVQDRSVDKIVVDVPFGNRCEWNAKKELPDVLREMLRVLKLDGRAVLLMQGYRLLLDLIALGGPKDIFHAPLYTHRLALKEKRVVVVGGFVCYVLILEIIACDIKVEDVCVDGPEE